MISGRADIPIILFMLASLVSFFLPVSFIGELSVYWWTDVRILFLVLIPVAAVIFTRIGALPEYLNCLLLTLAFLFAAAAPLMLIDGERVQKLEALGLWIFVGGLGFLSWRAMERMSWLTKGQPVASLIVPAFFGAWLLYLWQIFVTGFQVPMVLLPDPVQIAVKFSANTDILWADFYQTFMKSVISGFVLGCGSGFIVAVLVDRVPFLQRGLLPLGSLVSAIPIVGIAPIMVMWFGFDWHSKAAVIVVMTFFPMLVNCLTGFAATERMEYDLMRSYAANYWQTMFFVRLPNALPFIFNALKINSTLALIGAIVAEFFGTPIVGMGFRISTEVGRMNVDMVWATIAVAALAGSLFYGMLAVMERGLTFWHPSYRQSR